MTGLNAKLAYIGKAPFESKLRVVHFWRSGDRAQLDIGGVPSCQIDFSQLHIHILNHQSLGTGLNLELIMGPALVLLQAQCQTYCMHAGAVDTPVGRIGIIAESGAGKSTLSRHVDKHWSQVSDDILPLSINEAEKLINVLPDFPQLKLANNLVVDSPKKNQPLDYLLRISPEPSESIGFTELSRRPAMLQVVRHTVAAKLFDSSILRQHAHFAKRVSSFVPMIEISYPRDIDQLDHLRASIIDYLGSL